MLCIDVQCSIDDGSCLHDADFRICHIQTASTVAHHRVEFLQGSSGCFHICYRDTKGCSDILGFLISLRQEFMQRRIQQTDSYRTAAHCLINAFKIFCLIWLQRIQCKLSLLTVLGNTEHSDCLDALSTVEEHMLSTDKTDTFSSEFNSSSGICRRIGIGSDMESAALISPAHEGCKVAGNLSRNLLHFTSVDSTGCAIDRDCILLCECFTIDGKCLVFLIDLQFTASGYTAGTHTTCNNSCMGCHTTADSDNCLGSSHTLDILRRCLKTDKYDLLACLGSSFSLSSCEDDSTGTSTRRSGQTMGDDIALLSLEIFRIKLIVQQIVELLWFNHHQGLILCGKTFSDHVNSNLQSCICSTLAIAALQHVQLAILDGELHILHIMIMLFKRIADSYQIMVSFRHCLFEGRILFKTLFLRNASFLGPFL